MALEGRDAEIGLIYGFLGDEFPSALMQPADDLDPDDEWRIREAGLGIAAIRDGALTFQATYIRDPNTKVVRAIRQLFESEVVSKLTEGSRDEAVDQIVMGIERQPLLDLINAQSD